MSEEKDITHLGNHSDGGPLYQERNWYVVKNDAVVDELLEQYPDAEVADIPTPSSPIDDEDNEVFNVKHVKVKVPYGTDPFFTDDEETQAVPTSVTFVFGPVSENLPHLGAAIRGVMGRLHRGDPLYCIGSRVEFETAAVGENKDSWSFSIAGGGPVFSCFHVLTLVLTGYFDPEGIVNKMSYSSVEDKQTFTLWGSFGEPSTKEE